MIFPNTVDRTSTTAFLANARAIQAGVAGTVLDIATFDGTRVVADDLTIDGSGNVGVRGSIRAQGSISSVSSRSAKKDIRPFTEDPLALIRHTSVVTYLYKDEPPSAPLHIGFIAEDTPTELSGQGHDRYDVTNTVAVTLAAVQSLQRKTDRLDREIARLEKELGHDSVAP